MHNYICIKTQSLIAWQFPLSLCLTLCLHDTFLWSLAKMKALKSLLMLSPSLPPSRQQVPRGIPRPCHFHFVPHLLHCHLTGNRFREVYPGHVIFTLFPISSIATWQACHLIGKCVALITATLRFTSIPSECCPEYNYPNICPFIWLTN
jgi:hypothetical protein